MSEQQADNKEIGTDDPTAGATNAVVADYTVGRGLHRNNTPGRRGNQAILPAARGKSAHEELSLKRS